MLKYHALFILFLCGTNSVYGLPEGFKYLHEIDNRIEQEIRYYGSDNFMGRRVKGYQSPVCILTRKAAQKLSAIQQAAQKKGYRLKVYDCYRPQRAVNDFYHWSLNPKDTRQKNAFYPRVSKSQLFAKGYIAQYSGHSRGSTVDLTLVKLNHIPKKHSSLQRCYDRTPAYLKDNSVNMGTRFDCLDPSAHLRYKNLSKEQKRNRFLLQKLMKTHGFANYAKEWWHFTLKNEPYPKTYFDFPVQ